jgi:acyl carrier protein
MNKTLEEELAHLIINICDVQAIAEKDIRPDDPLIGPDSPMSLDSLDAIEIIVAVQRQYHIRIDSQDNARKILTSIKTLADFIRRETQSGNYASVFAS